MYCPPTAQVLCNLLKIDEKLWRREWESSNAISRSPMFATVLGSSLATAAIWRLPICANVCVRLPAFAGFSIAMTLEMALDAIADAIINRAVATIVDEP